MKHFRVTIWAESYGFERECDTISEAYDALQSASAEFKIRMDLNDVMEKLVSMKNGTTISTQTDMYSIRVVNIETDADADGKE